MSVVGGNKKSFPRSPSDPGAPDEDHDQYYSGLRNGLWDWKHIRRMGSALGLFGWLVSRQTRQNGNAGLVLGGKPLRLEEICKDLNGATRRSVQRWLQVLRRGGYIETEARLRGVVITILNAKKEKWSQKSLFPPAPDVAHQAATRCARSGAPGVRCGAPRLSYLSMKSKRKSKEEAPPSLHSDIRIWCARDWEGRFGRKPSWAGRDNKALSELLRVRADLTPAEVQATWKNYMASTQQFYDDAAWPLWAFCHDFDGLSRHPLHDRGRRGAVSGAKSNGGGKFAAYTRKASDL